MQNYICLKIFFLKLHNSYAITMDENWIRNPHVAIIQFVEHVKRLYFYLIINAISYLFCSPTKLFFEICKCLPFFTNWLRISLNILAAKRKLFNCSTNNLSFVPIGLFCSFFTWIDIIQIRNKLYFLLSNLFSFWKNVTTISRHWLL